MTQDSYNLAFETSGPLGSVSLGRGDELLATADMPPQQRHRLDLLPTIDQLCRTHGVTPRQIGEVYLSIGPGSFTGLRIGVTTAQMLGSMLGAKLVAVPTLEVVVANAAPGEVKAHLLACLNLKRDAVYAGVFAWNQGQWRAVGQPGLDTIAQWLARVPRPVAIMGNPLPTIPQDSEVAVLPAELARPRSPAVWKLGRAAACAGRFIEPMALRPLYAREPEAKELWDRREESKKAEVRSKKTEATRQKTGVSNVGTPTELFMLPKIVIVGRPNVGKSSLLNLLAGRLVSIVDPTPGVTRDRISTMAELPQLLATQTRSRRRRGADRAFEADDEVESARPDNKPLPVELIDTGGYGIQDSQNLTADVERQIGLGLAEADVILFIIDAQSGIVALDQEVARLLRNSAGKKGKPVLLVANKVDSEKDEAGAAEAARLGFGPPLMVSALSGNNKELLTEAIRANLPRAATAAPDARAAELGVLLAIAGKRNAGKSTLVNALSGQDRMIVSELEGTTRDSVDVRFEYGDKVFTAIDTAGIRKTKSLKGDVEFYSQHRALRSIRRADVVLLLLDATVPVSHVDQQLAHEIVAHFKPAMIVVNKWDLAEQALQRDLATQDKYMEYLDKHLPILNYAPVAFISAKRDEGLRELLDMAMKLHRQAAERVSTSGLNKAMEAAMAAKPPSSGIGRRPRVYYMTQLAVQPPTIILFVNDPTMFDPAYQRYLINRFRETLPFAEVPIRLIIRGRNDNEGPHAPPPPDKKRRSKV